MSIDERRVLVIAEFAGAMREIVNDAHNLNRVKWIAMTALRNAEIIANEGRVPSTEETIEWLRQQGMARDN